jgi:hypothetical protein
MQEIKENDVVAMLVDLPELKLSRGDVGTVVEVFNASGQHPAGYIVEFVADSGEVYAHADITDAAQFIPLCFKREAA